ncbi:hypothetical protein J2W53_003203 [Pseudomonas frederiksbergensis]|mgnify:CR=1 FL=1|nr:hypothetical protein [Pseudomonas frederiksbergensis]
MASHNWALWLNPAPALGDFPEPDSLDGREDHNVPGILRSVIYEPEGPEGPEVIKLRPSTLLKILSALLFRNPPNLILVGITIDGL